jgi:hypothetical protein
MEQAIALIQIRIQDHKNEIESFYMNDSDFVNSKQIRHLHNLIKENEKIIELLKFHQVPI